MKHHDWFNDKRVLITGHKGFIGTALTARLKQLGAMVSGMDLRDDKRTGDACNRASVFLKFHGFVPQCVIHLAALTEVRASFARPAEFYHDNVVGALNILEACRGHGIPLVVASSDKAYGRGSVPYVESQPLQHDADPYSSSKAMADQLAQDYGRLYNMPIRIARCCNIYGPSQHNETTLITNTIKRCLAGQPFQIVAGTAHVKREWMFIDDAVEAYLLLAHDAGTVDNKSGSPFNVGTCYVMTTLAIATLAAKLVSGSDDWKYESIGGVPAQIGDQRLNSRKFRKAFPLWDTVNIYDGLEKTIAWHRSVEN